MFHILLDRNQVLLECMIALITIKGKIKIYPLSQILSKI